MALQPLFIRGWKQLSAYRTHRIITVGTCKLRIENTYGRKQNKALSDILSPPIFLIKI